MSIIKVEKLTKSYNGTRAVDGVDFAVNEGEVFGFLGPNGAGKTTTINILCTLLLQDSGLASVAGIDTVKDPHGVRSEIGLVFQEMTLDNELTAYENLKFHCYMYNMKRRLAEERIDEMLLLVGLNDKRNDMVKTFSGGMKRRLEIVRGLLHRPRVLFLDEPTLGLDPQARSDVWGFIAELKKKEGNTVFMTTHYMDEAEICDRIAIIDTGKIIAVDTPDALKSSLKGDTVFISTEDDELAATEIREKFNIEAIKLEAGLSFIVQGGESFVPKLFQEISVPIRTISVKRPSLDDVFIKLTGRGLRDDDEDTKPQNRLGRRRR